MDTANAVSHWNIVLRFIVYFLELALWLVALTATRSVRHELAAPRSRFGLGQIIFQVANPLEQQAVTLRVVNACGAFYASREPFARIAS